jgi:hypothetical protein
MMMLYSPGLRTAPVLAGACCCIRVSRTPIGYVGPFVSAYAVAMIERLTLRWRRETSDQDAAVAAGTLSTAAVDTVLEA